jgi:S-(hydroxymethyl)glutathione dehydrogenase / alcohol dehydrogenase
MRAAVLHEVGQPLLIESDLEQPSVSRSQVRVEIAACGVCHSDLSAAVGLVPFQLPVILGHEAVGRVVEVGKDVATLSAGDQVIAALTPACGHCWYCVRDQSHLCETMQDPATVSSSSGVTYRRMANLGAFATEIVVPEAALVKVESDLPPEQIALIGCAVSTGVGAALNTAVVSAGSSVAVFGCGGVGQAIIQGARIAGAATIIALDPLQFKRDVALQLGATDAVDPSADDAVGAVRELTNGRGVDYSFEATGHPETVLTAFEAARRGGTITIVSMPPATATIQLPVGGFFRTGKRLLGSYNGSSQVRRDFHRLITFIETGQLDLGAMVTKVIRLDEINEAFRAMQSGEIIRTVIV